MTADTFFALVVFSLVASMTPGPNNVMLMASGVNFGFRRTVPHMLGIVGGFLLLMACVALGLGALFAAFPALHLVLKIVGGGYLLYLAWKIGASRKVDGGRTTANPMTFLEAAAFQWVNPKAWVVGVTVISVYSQPASLVSAAFVVLAFTLLSLPSILVWSGFGTLLRGFLADPVRLKWFNIAMGVLLALTLLPLLA